LSTCPITQLPFTHLLSSGDEAEFGRPLERPGLHLRIVQLAARQTVDAVNDPVPSEGNLLIRVVEQENEFIGSRLVNGIYVVSDLQLYLDLWAMGGRGQEAAEELRKGRLKF